MCTLVGILRYTVYVMLDENNNLSIRVQHTDDLVRNCCWEQIKNKDLLYESKLKSNIRD